MRRSTKVTLVVALCFTVLGIAFYAAAVGLTGRFALDPVELDTVGTETHQKIIEASFRSIRVSDVECDIRILPSSDSQTTVEYTDTDLYRHTVQVRDDTLVITVEDVGSYLDRLFLISTGDQSVTIYLPFQTLQELQLSTVSGDIGIADPFTAEELTAETVSGNVGISCQIAEELSICTTSGVIALEQISPAELNIETVSGEVILTDIHVSDFAELSSVSGNLLLNGVDCPSLSAETVSGNVIGTVPSPKHFQTETTSGTIFISENRSDAPEWEIETVSGDIRITVAP